MSLKDTIYLLGFSAVAALISLSASAAQTLTIKGSIEDAGDVIQLADEAELILTAHGEGITVTLPDVDVRLRCLGEPTAEGYCLLSAGDGSSLVDSDGDGVPNDNDLCFSTPAGSFVNNSGCSCDQLGSSDACNDGGGNGGGGGGGTTPTDTDGDGVPDSSDNCPNDANANQADNDNDGIGNACDSTPDGSGGNTGGGGGSGAYCSNAATSNVTCSSSRNFDNWWATRGDERYTIPARKILSIPFTVRASTTDAAMYAYSTDMTNLTGYSWSSWVSTRPGGAQIQGPCSKSGNEARGNFYMTQKPAQSAECNFGTSSGVYYLNYRVYSSSNGYYPAEYTFDVGKRAY